MTRRGHLIASLVLAAVAVAALLAFLPPWSTLQQAALSVSPRMWLGVALLFAGSYVVRALRLQAEWAGHRRVGLGECLHVTLVHSAAVNLLPMRAGEAGYPLLLRSRWGVSLAEAGLSLLWLRLQDAVVLAAWALVAFSDWSLPVRASLALSSVVLVAALLPMLARRWRRSPTGAPVLQRIARAVLRGGHVGWFYTVANWTLKLVALGMLLSALTVLPPEVGWAGALGGELAAVMPLQAPGGAGTYEAGVWVAIGLAHDGPGLAQVGPVLGAALIVHVFVLLVSVSGALVSRLLAGLRPLPVEHLS